MEIDIIYENFIRTQNKVELLSKHTNELLLQPELLAIVLEEISIALEELQVQQEELLATRRELEVERQFYKDLFEFVPEAYLVTNVKGVIQRINQAAAELFKVRQDFLIGKPLLVFVADQDRKFFITKLNMIAQLLQPQKWEITFGLRDGSTFPAEITISSINNTEGDEPIGIRWLIQDISERKHKELQMRHDLLHDSLTKLPNRILLLERLEYALLRYQRNQNQLFALLFIDLDNFKNINDNYGHICGDLVLIEIANRLLNTLRTTDTVVRLSGDEFVILLQDILTIEDATHCATRIQQALTTPIVFDCHEEIIIASIGIALSHPVYEFPEQIIRDADSAMYQSKKNKNAAYTVWANQSE